MLLANAGKFAISFLGKDQAHIGRRFAGQHPEIADRFAGLDWTTTPNGVPALTDAVAWLDCIVAHTYPGGDHTIFVGEVVGVQAREGAPLIYFRSGYHHISND